LASLGDTQAISGVLNSPEFGASAELQNAAASGILKNAGYPAGKDPMSRLTSILNVQGAGGSTRPNAKGGIDYGVTLNENLGIKAEDDHPLQGPSSTSDFATKMGGNVVDYLTGGIQKAYGEPAPKGTNLSVSLGESLGISDNTPKQKQSSSVSDYLAGNAKPQTVGGTSKPEIDFKKSIANALSSGASSFDIFNAQNQKVGNVSAKGKSADEIGNNLLGLGIFAGEGTSFKPVLASNQKIKEENLQSISNLKQSISQLPANKPISILDSSGKVIGTTSKGGSPLFDILKAESSAKGPISLFYTTESTIPASSVLKNGKIDTEKFPASEVSPIGEFLKGAYSQQYNIFGPPTVQQKTPVSTFFSGLFNASGELIKGKNPSETFGKGINETENLVKERPQFAAGSLLEELGFNLATAGTGEFANAGLKIGSAVSRGIKNIPKLNENIRLGLQEEAVPSAIETQKGSSYDIFGQGTEGRTSIPSSSITSDILGIGKAGEAVPVRVIKQTGKPVINQPDYGIGGFSKATTKFKGETKAPDNVNIPNLFTNPTEKVPYINSRDLRPPSNVNDIFGIGKASKEIPIKTKPVNINDLAPDVRLIGNDKGELVPYSDINPNIKNYKTDLKGNLLPDFIVGKEGEVLGRPPRDILEKALFDEAQQKGIIPKSIKYSEMERILNVPPFHEALKIFNKEKIKSYDEPFYSYGPNEKGYSLNEIEKYTPIEEAFTNFFGKSDLAKSLPLSEIDNLYFTRGSDILTGKGNPKTKSNIDKIFEIPRKSKAKTGPVENSLAFIGKGSEAEINIVRKTTQDEFAPHAILFKGIEGKAIPGLTRVPDSVDLFYNKLTGETKLIEKGKADIKRLTKAGFERQPAHVDWYYGKSSPSIQLKIRQAMNKGLANEITDMFGFAKADVGKSKASASLYGYLSRNPEKFEKIGPEISRPFVTRVYESINKGIEKPKERLSGTESGALGKAKLSSQDIGFGSSGLDRIFGDLGFGVKKNIINPETGKAENIYFDFTIPKGEPVNYAFIGPIKPVKVNPAKSFGGEFTTSEPAKVGAGASGKGKALAKQISPETEREISNAFLSLKLNEKNIKPSTTKPTPFTSFAPTVSKGKNKNTNDTGLGFEIISYPQGTEEKFRAKSIPQTGVDTVFGNITGLSTSLNSQSTTKQQQKSKSLFIDTSSLVNVKQNIKQNNQDIFGLGIGQRLKTGPKLIPAQGLFQVPIQTPSQTPIQTPITVPIQGQETVPITTPITVPVPPPERPPPPVTSNPFFPAGYFQGTKYSFPNRPGKTKRTYILFSTNPNVVGEFYTKGVAEVSKSSSPSVFNLIDRAVGKSKRSNSLSAFVSAGEVRNKTKPIKLTSGNFNRKSKPLKPKKYKNTWFTG